MSTGVSPPPRIPDHELLEIIGRGSYGEVWRARNIVGAERAVKVVWRASFGSDRPYEREFVGIQKFEPVSRRHEGLVDILHVGRAADDRYFYYVMELADNATSPGAFEIEAKRAETGYTPLTLRALLKARGKLPLSEVLELGVAMCGALGHLHRHGLVHRDVKPSNLLFVGGRVKLADIGLVAAIDEAKSFVGTEGYIPPEGPGAPSADLYSLGKVLYEAATGKDRHDFPDLPDEFRSGEEGPVLADLNEILLRACALDPARRYSSADSMRAELLLVQAGQSIRGLRANERLLRWLRVAAGVCAVLLLIAVGAGWWQRQRAAEHAAQVAALAAKEEQRRQTAYAADMAIAFQSWEAGRAELTRQLLEEQRPAPDRDDLRGWEWRYLWAQTRSREPRRLGTDSHAGFWSCAISPDGQTIAGGVVDGYVELGDAQTGEPLGPLKAVAFSDPVDSIAFSHDGRTLLQSLRFSGQVIAWDLASRQPKLRFGPGRTGLRLALSPDDSLIATADGPAYSPAGPGVVQLWDAATGREVTRSTAQPTFLIRAEFSSDGKHLATAGGRGHAKIWSVPDLREVAVLPHENGREVFGLAFSPDGERLLTGSQDGLVRVWDWRTSRLLAIWFGHSFGVEAARWSPDGSAVATGGRDQIVRLWSATNFAELIALKGHAARVTGLAFSPDGQRLASASVDKTLRIWDLAQASWVVPSRPWRASILDPELAISPNSRWLALKGPSNAVELLTLPSLESIARVPGDRPVFAPDAHGLVTRSTNQLLFFSVPDVRLQHVFESAEPLVGVPVFSSDGRHLAAISSSSQVLVWQTTNASSVVRLASPTNRLEGVFFMRGLQELVTLRAADGMLEWFDLETGQSTRQLTTGEGSVTSVALSPDGAFVLIGETAARLRLVELASGRVERLNGDTGSVLSVAWSPDGQTLVGGTFEGFIKLWNTRTRRELAALRGHSTMVTALEFSRDGRHLVSGSVDNTWRIWSAPTLIEADGEESER
ncbi:MAG TPA: serine/threonine-protein kinase [Verrucomicrobiota bacterium]|nr:serine/threonine-protein kinase [Verrucomicrobiota bacterium]